MSNEIVKGHIEISDAESKQRDHYNKIINSYDLHYGDEWSQTYRSEFIFPQLFKGVELKGKKVLEAMCGSGMSTGYLLAHGAEVTGLDISDDAIDRFRKKWQGVDCIRASVLDMPIDDSTFDVVVVHGGLHHIHPHFDDAIMELNRVLKIGGTLCFFEPHDTSFADVVRQVWYKLDKCFEANEAAISIRHLTKRHKSILKPVSFLYGGNVAYLLVFNSMIFRVPHRLKKLYTPPLMFLERLMNPILPAFLKCFVIGRMQKL